MVKKKKTEEPMEVLLVKHERATFTLVGTTPLIVRRVSEKAKMELLAPQLGKKSKAAQRVTAKHNPYEEFLDSPYISEEEGDPTLLLMPAECFKNALCDVSLDVEGGVSRMRLRRQTYVHGDYVPIWGIPCLKMDIVRSANQQKTPDVRTRLCVKEWAALVTIEYSVPILNGASIANLIANAGAQGVGDWRQQKGAGNYGQWEVVDPQNPYFKKLKKKAGRRAQKKAMATPEMYDRETRKTLAWFEEESAKQGFSEIQPVASLITEGV